MASDKITYERPDNNHLLLQKAIVSVSKRQVLFQLSQLGLKQDEQTQSVPFVDFT